MSLKAFHIGFITVSTGLAVGFGVWAIRDYNANGEATSLVIGIGSLAGAVALVTYGVWFIKKLKGGRWT